MTNMAHSGQDGLYFKCILLGAPGVGKTCLANRVTTGKFIDSPITTFSTPSTLITLPLPSGAQATMELWDTAGQERYLSLTSSYFRHSQAVLVVYDLQHKTKIADWLKEVARYLPHNEALVFLVGSKLDLGSDVTLTEAEVAGLCRVEAVEVEIEEHFVLSSKTGENVQNAFTMVAQCVWRAGLEKRVDVSRRQGTIRLGHRGADSHKSDRCCS